MMGQIVPNTKRMISPVWDHQIQYGLLTYLALRRRRIVHI